MKLTTENNLKEKHRVIKYGDLKLWVCVGHCCDIDGVSAIK